jgi:hypothetical protein
MRSWFSEDLPLVRYSVWCLLLLLGHVFLSHLDRVVHDLMQAVGPQVFLFFRAVTEIGDSKWTLVPTGSLGLVLLVAGRYVCSGHRVAAMCRWLGAASFLILLANSVSAPTWRAVGANV